MIASNVTIRRNQDKCTEAQGNASELSCLSQSKAATARILATYSSLVEAFTQFLQHCPSIPLSRNALPVQQPNGSNRFSSSYCFCSRQLCHEETSPAHGNLLVIGFISRTGDITFIFTAYRRVFNIVLLLRFENGPILRQCHK